MQYDNRAYLEFRFDGETADVVLVAFADVDPFPVHTVTREWTFDAPEGTDLAVLDKVKELLVQIVEEL